MGYVNDLVRFTLDAFRSRRTPSLKKMLVQADEEEQNPLMMQFYTWESRGNENSSWWKYFENEVPHLKEIGVSHVWLPPMSKSATKKFCGYDTYDLWDLGEFYQKDTIATRWGTKGELLKSCAVANSHDIGIIVDAVLNHKCGADAKESFQAVPVEQTNRLVRAGPPREIEAWTFFNFPGRQNKYSGMKWNHVHFSGIDWDSRTRIKGIYYIPGPGRSGWSKYVAKELGNYDYLLECDIDHRQTDVKQDLFNWGSWIIEQTGAVGFRMDAMKHYDRRFLREFLNRAKKNTRKLDLFAVSEFWSGNIKILEQYVDLLQGTTSFFDVPLHYCLHHASRQGSDYDLRNILSDTLVGKRPWEAVTFVDNHDTQIGQSLESWVYPEFKLQAYALILLRSDGFPCIFYGDLYPGNECYDPRIGPKLELLIQARKNFAYGSTVDYFQYRDCIGFVRSGTAHRPGCAVVLRSGIGSGKAMDEPTPLQATMVPATPGNVIISDQCGKEIRMRAPTSAHKRGNGPMRFRDLLGQDLTPVEVAADGWATFSCPEGSVAVWVAEIES